MHPGAARLRSFEFFVIVADGVKQGQLCFLQSMSYRCGASGAPRFKREIHQPDSTPPIEKTPIDSPPRL